MDILDDKDGYIIRNGKRIINYNYYGVERYSLLKDVLKKEKEDEKRLWSNEWISEWLREESLKVKYNFKEEFRSIDEVFVKIIIHPPQILKNGGIEKNIIFPNNWNFLKSIMSSLKGDILRRFGENRVGVFSKRNSFVKLGENDEYVFDIIKEKYGSYEENKIREYREKKLNREYDDKIYPSILSFYGRDIRREEIESVVKSSSYLNGVVYECRIYGSKFNGYEKIGKEEVKYSKRINLLKRKLKELEWNSVNISTKIREEYNGIRRYDLKEIDELCKSGDYRILDNKNFTIIKEVNRELRGNVVKESNKLNIKSDVWKGMGGESEEKYYEYSNKEIKEKYGSKKNMEIKIEEKIKQLQTQILPYVCNVEKVIKGELSRSKKMFELEEESLSLKIQWDNCYKKIEREIKRIKELKKVDLRYVMERKRGKLNCEGFICVGGEIKEDKRELVKDVIWEELERDGYVVDFGKMYKEYWDKGNIGYEEKVVKKLKLKEVEDEVFHIKVNNKLSYMEKLFVLDDE